jgi:hypothetical protein
MYNPLSFTERRWSVQSSEIDSDHKKFKNFLIDGTRGEGVDL